MNRRTFLAQTATAAIGTAMGTVTAEAVEPFVRNGQPKFKYSLAAYSYRQLLQGKNATLTLADFVADCAKMGLEGTELTSYYFPNPTTPEYLRELKRQCFLLGLDVSGTAVGNDFGHPAGDTRAQQIANVKRWVDYSEILGAPVIRIFAGHARPGQAADEAYKLMVEGIEECCDYAGKHGVYLALENHGGPTATAEGLLRFVQDVKSPWFGVNLDTGNFRTADVYGDLARVAPYALNVQIKVVIADSAGKREPADFRRFAKILRDAAYRGYVVLEFEEAGDPRVECPKYVAQMREMFA